MYMILSVWNKVILHLLSYKQKIFSFQIIIHMTESLYTVCVEEP